MARSASIASTSSAVATAAMLVRRNRFSRRAAVQVSFRFVEQLGGLGRRAAYAQSGKGGTECLGDGAGGGLVPALWLSSVTGHAHQRDRSRQGATSRGT